jgi:hypothetical protein
MIYAVEHLQRSGGHAIIFWIIEHLNNYTFQNNLNMQGAPTDTIPKGNKNIIYSLENKTKDTSSKTPDKRILILRDPLNWTASIIKRRGNMSFYKNKKLIKDNECLEFYKDYYNKYKSKEYYGINYNKWFSSSEYRREIEADFGFDKNDKSMTKVLKYGSGSSFDGNKFDGKAQNMKTLERWQKFKDHPIILKIQTDEEFKEILKEFNL